jgi:outer membrane lipoprotein carrier protein
MAGNCSCRFLFGAVVLALLFVSRVSGDELPIVTYFRALEFFSAEFEEQRFSPQGDLVSSSQGKCRIHKPRKLHWEYSVPAEQLIVSDGDTLWIYEPELEQVIISSISTMTSTALGPLLGTSESLDKLYTFKAMSNANWFQLRPVSGAQLSDTVKADIKFMDGQIDEIRLLDGLGFVTRVIFSKVDHKAFESDIFHFVPPKNVDVVGAAFNRNRGSAD